MSLTEEVDGHFCLPEGVMYDGKPLRMPITKGASRAHNAMTWQANVRQEYERQESEAAESSRKGTPVPRPEERGVAHADDKAGVRPTVPAVEQTIEEVIQARLEAATVACETAAANLKEAEEAYANACVEESKLKLLVEVLPNE